MQIDFFERPSLDQLTTVPLREHLTVAVVGLGLLAGFFVIFSVASVASVRAIPLPELVKTSDSIITGRIIKTEKTEIREGVHEVVCHTRRKRVKSAYKKLGSRLD